MNKSELVKEISKKNNISQKESAIYLNSFIDIIISALKRGDNINLVGFGKFDIKSKSERKTYNPITKSKITIPAGKLPYFRAGKGLKQAVL